MSNYTTELRWWCEEVTGMKGESPSKVIPKAAPLLFDFSFPFWSFNLNDKTAFQIKIIRHFYTREIGFETMGLFKLKLEDKMNEIMPYFNKLYAANNKEFNFLNTDEANENETAKIDTSANFTTNTDRNDNGISKYSDTPQGSITDLEAGNYMTNATIDEASSKAETAGQNNGEEARTATRTYTGRRGASGGRLLSEYYEAQKNIDRMLFKELNVLFMNIW